LSDGTIRITATTTFLKCEEILRPIASRYVDFGELVVEAEAVPRH
jgi:hypothetical protein